MHMMPRPFLLAAFATASVTALHAQPPVTLELVQVATGLTRITDIAHCGDERLFCTLQAGSIRIVNPDGSVLPTPFLQIPVQNAGNEQGLLGLAFDPDYATNGRFYVNYTVGASAGSTRISRFTVSADPNVADATSEEVLLTFSQPFTNHNGGDLDFGPDGYLYVPTGDGGSGGDPQNNGQNRTTYHGNILRIDVSGNSGYTVPPDNPFIGQANVLPEIWAWGLRNPWRFGFDRATGDVWIGDVGQNAWEEVDFWPAGDNSGPNFGWRCYEGLAPYNTSGCQGPANYVPPVQVHPTASNQWCSVIGGRVYRGTEFDRLAGRYIYTDYCKGDFHSLVPDGDGGWTNELLLESGFTGFSVIAENAAGELFAGRSSNGRLYRIVDPCPFDAPAITQEGDTLYASPGAASYVWSLNGSPIVGGTDGVLVATASGSYTVAANLGGGCLFESAPLWVSLVGIEERGAFAWQVWPNPTRGQLTVEGLPAGSCTMRLLDTTGREVYTSTRQVGGPVVLETGGLPVGGYLLEVRAAALDQVLHRWVSVVR